MGAFSFISINEYPILDVKNSYYSFIKDKLFYEKDLVFETRSNSALNKLYWGTDNVNRPGYFDFVGFQQTTAVCKKRLELLGYTYKSAKKNFEYAKKINRDEMLADVSFVGLKYSGYLEMIKEIIEKKLITYESFSANAFDYFTSNDLMIPHQGVFEGLYSILSVVSDKTDVIYDLSDIYQAGYITLDDIKQFNPEKIIILTEGKTDIEFLNSSLTLLYPHLSHFYHFLDFDGYKVEGGGSALVRLVKGFAAANVKHPIIALFDNDTAGTLEMNKLKSYNLPENIKILKYPDIDLAKKYPTIGPQGKKVANINGKACGIEMYLGKELLQNENELMPVRWLDYNPSVGAYHGVIEGKERIQKEFRARLKDGKTWDMSEMSILLESIFKAFN